MFIKFTKIQKGESELFQVRLGEPILSGKERPPPSRAQPLRHRGRARIPMHSRAHAQRQLQLLELELTGRGRAAPPWLQLCKDQPMISEAGWAQRREGHAEPPCAAPPWAGACAPTSRRLGAVGCRPTGSLRCAPPSRDRRPPAAAARRRRRRRCLLLFLSLSRVPLPSPHPSCLCRCRCHRPARPALAPLPAVASCSRSAALHCSQCSRRAAAPPRRPAVLLGPRSTHQTTHPAPLGVAQEARSSTARHRSGAHSGQLTAARRRHCAAAVVSAHFTCRSARAAPPRWHAAPPPPHAALPHHARAHYRLLALPGRRASRRAPKCGRQLTARSRSPQVR